MRKGQRGKKIGPSSGRAALSPKDRLRQQAYGLRNVRNFPQAKPLLEELYRLEPDNMPLALDLGEAYMETEDFGAATSLYAKLIEKDPKNISAVTNLGGSLIRQGKLNDARSILEYALQLDPKSIHARINLASVLQASGERKANLDNALEAVQIDPSSSLAFNNLGSALSDMAMFKEAKHAYETAVMLDSQQVDALINLAAVEARLGDSKASAEMYERVLKLLPKEAEQRAEAVKFYAAFEYLKQGVLEKGWDYYEGGFSPLVPANGARSPRRTFSVPSWDGKPLNGKTLLVWREQGLGDELLFYTCLHELKEMGGNIIVECDKRLVEVMARSFPEFTIRAEIFLPQQESCSPHSDFDFHLPLGSLMRYFRPTIESFNRSGAYIKPNPVRVAKFQERLAPYKDDCRLVGICWRSGKLDPVRNLSYTTLDEWGEVLRTPSFKFVNLQYGECEAELKDAEEKYGIEILRWPDLNLRNDLDDIFALMTCLDAVASVQTAVLTMAGCAGTPSVGVKAGGWTALGREHRSPWFNHVNFEWRLRCVVEALKAAYLEPLLVEHHSQPKDSELLRTDAFKWSTETLNRAVFSRNIDAMAQLEIAEQLLDEGSLTEQGAQRVLELYLDRDTGRTLRGLDRRCSVAFKLLMNGFSEQAKAVSSWLLDHTGRLSPQSQKDLGVLLAVSGHLDSAIELIGKAYKKDSLVKNGYSELAELVLDTDSFDLSIELLERDLFSNRLCNQGHLHTLLNLYGLSGSIDAVPMAINGWMDTKGNQRPTNPYSSFASGLWQASGFANFYLDVWELDFKYSMTNVDRSYMKSLSLRAESNFEESNLALLNSSYRGAGLFTLLMFNILNKDSGSSPGSLLGQLAEFDSPFFLSSPLYLSYVGRYELAEAKVRGLSAKDRLLSKNSVGLIWWIKSYNENGYSNPDEWHFEKDSETFRSRPSAWYRVFANKVKGVTSLVS